MNIVYIRPTARATNMAKQNCLSNTINTIREICTRPAFQPNALSNALDDLLTKDPRVVRCLNEYHGRDGLILLIPNILSHLNRRRIIYSIAFVYAYFKHKNTFDSGLNVMRMSDERVLSFCLEYISRAVWNAFGPDYLSRVVYEFTTRRDYSKQYVVDTDMHVRESLIGTIDSDLSTSLARLINRDKTFIEIIKKKCTSDMDLIKFLNAGLNKKECLSRERIIVTLMSVYAYFNYNDFDMAIFRLTDDYKLALSAILLIKSRAGNEMFEDTLKFLVQSR